MSGVVVWFTGLPSSGKSTLAGRVRARLGAKDVPSCLLDSDVLRRRLAPLLGYSDDARAAFYAALANLAAELAEQGLVVLVAATAHRRRFRREARALAPRFVEVWLTTPLEECRHRDAKGLYAAAAHDSGTTLPGVAEPYEAPQAAEVLARGGDDEAAVTRVVKLVG